MLNDFFNSTWYVIKPYPFKSMWSYNIWPLKNKCPTYTNAPRISVMSDHSFWVTRCLLGSGAWLGTVGIYLPVPTHLAGSLRCGMEELVSPKATGTKEAVVVAAVVVVQWLSCVQLFCNPRHCSPPGSSVHGISQARILAAAKSLRSCLTVQPHRWQPTKSGLQFPSPRDLLNTGIKPAVSCIGRWTFLPLSPQRSPGGKKARCNQRERNQRNATPVREAGQKQAEWNSWQSWRRASGAKSL